MTFERDGQLANPQAPPQESKFKSDCVLPALTKSHKT